MMKWIIALTYRIPLSAYFFVGFAFQVEWLLRIAMIFAWVNIISTMIVGWGTRSTLDLQKLNEKLDWWKVHSAVCIRIHIPNVIIWFLLVFHGWVVTAGFWMTSMIILTRLINRVVALKEPMRD